ncbi:DUF433 domain-containing protein [Paraburkholderia phenazinium]|uniref:DUF433 domain-containing protein n=1 Tax=Paraburkholderia phenazinium TaxID=60549 RepID=UPI00158E9700|nr:DUF433 domain-containing protein [Paraburkholderia phenazinium]
MSNIIEDPQILHGAPCFNGTRVSIENVVASRRAGVPFDELKTDYPFLTERLLDEAEAYLKDHPPTYRPRRVAEIYPDLRLISRTIVRPAKTSD